MMKFCFVSAVLLAVPALALPSSIHVNHVVHEKRDTIQRKWVRSSDLHPDYVLPARVGLKQSNLELGEQYLSEM